MSIENNRVSEILQDQIRQQKDGLKESLQLVDRSLSPDALQFQLAQDYSLQEKIQKQQDGLKESLQLLDESLSPDALRSQLDNDHFLSDYSSKTSDSGLIDLNRVPADYSATTSDSGVIDLDRVPVMNSQMESRDFLAESSEASSDSVIELDRLPNRFHLNLSRCIAFQSLNESADDSDEASMKFTHLHMRDLSSGAEQAAFAPCDSEFTYCSNEEAMMNFHKEILYAEFRDLLRNHPQGGEMTVDAHKLRILLDLMHRHSCRLEDQLRSCYGLRFNGGGVQPDFEGTNSSSAEDSSEQSSMSSFYSRPKYD